MTDFDITQWADFVRGVGDPELEEDMQESLDRGSTAGNLAKMLHRVAAVGRADAETPVPESAVRIAKAIGTTTRFEDRPAIRRVPCWLTFDSLLEPAAAGARGIQEAHRELSFEAHRSRLVLLVNELAAGAAAR